MRVQVGVMAWTLALATGAAAQEAAPAGDVAPGFAATQPDVAVGADGASVVVVFGGTRLASAGKTAVVVHESEVPEREPRVLLRRLP